MCQSMVHMNNSSQINIIIKMSKKKHVVSSQEIISFNMWRFQQIGKPLSSEEMRNKLCRDLDYPKDRHFFAAITKEPNAPIIHMGATRNALYAVSPRPVHITRLQTVWDDYTKSKKATPNKEELAHQKWAKQHLEFCIKVLKEQGLKVLKPGIQVELGYTEV